MHFSFLSCLSIERFDLRNMAGVGGGEWNGGILVSCYGLRISLLALIGFQGDGLSHVTGWVM
jgi:hypothetical protein